jgi:DHA1 family tetracycline resistance protein-like MFS transporter
VQGWLTGRVAKRLGEWKTAYIGMLVTALSYVAYGLATEGWMIYLLLVIGSIGGMAAPALQGLISNSVANDEQGAIQGAITSLESVSGIVGPLMVTSLFSYFIRPGAPIQLPGAPFFACAILALLALWVAVRARKAH